MQLETAHYTVVTLLCAVECLAGYYIYIFMGRFCFSHR